jgi:hypothetical protein
LQRVAHGAAFANVSLCEHALRLSTFDFVQKDPLGVKPEKDAPGALPARKKARGEPKESPAKKLIVKVCRVAGNAAAAGGADGADCKIAQARRCIARAEDSATEALGAGPSKRARRSAVASGEEDPRESGDHGDKHFHEDDLPTSPGSEAAAEAAAEEAAEEAARMEEAAGEADNNAFTMQELQQQFPKVTEVLTDGVVDLYACENDKGELERIFAKAKQSDFSAKKGSVLASFLEGNVSSQSPEQDMLDVLEYKITSSGTQSWVLLDGGSEAVRISVALSQTGNGKDDVKDMLYGHSVSQTGDKCKVMKLRGKSFYFTWGGGILQALRPQHNPKHAQWVFVLRANDEKQRLEPKGAALVLSQKMDFSIDKYVGL